jgi:hypothetical protein
MKTQEADRLAQQSAANIGLIKKQIEQYDIDAKQREADVAAEKAEGEAFQQLVSAGGKLSDDQLGSVLSGLSPEAQVRAITLRNQLDPEQAYTIVDLPNGEKAMLYGNQMMRISTQEKSKLPDSYVKGLALIKEQFAEGTPEYDRAVQDLTDRTLGYDVSSGESAFGGQPAGGAAGGVPIAPTETENILFERLPDNIFTEDNMVDPEVLEAELAKMDFLSPQEVERMRQFAAQESVNRRRDAYLEATGEKPEEKPGFLKSFLSANKAGLELLRRSPEIFRRSPELLRRSLRGGSSVREGGGSSPTSAAPTTSRSAQEIIGEARAIQGLPSEVQLQDRALKQRQAAFDNAKELARQELIKKLSGPEREKVLKELEDARIDKIMSLKGESAQTETQKKVREALLKFLRGPEFIRQYGIDELPGKLIDLIPDMRTKRERERLERLEKQQSK